MYRKIIKQLKEWKEKKDRLPLILKAGKFHKILQSCNISKYVVKYTG